MLGIAIGIIFILFIEPLVRNISDTITCLFELAQMALTEKAAKYEARINEIRGLTPDVGENQTRAIGFTIDSEEQEYDDDES